MAKFRKRPVTIEAWQNIPGEPWPVWLKAVGDDTGHGPNGTILIRTLEGVMTAQSDDWIIRGVKGEIYPCKPDIFEATYEPVGEIDPDEESWGDGPEPQTWTVTP